MNRDLSSVVLNSMSYVIWNLKKKIFFSCSRAIVPYWQQNILEKKMIDFNIIRLKFVERLPKGLIELYETSTY